MINKLLKIISGIAWGVPREYSEELPGNITFNNIGRQKIFSVMLIVINLPFLYFDYYNWKKTLWISAPGYRYLCYLHLAVIAVSLLFLLAIYAQKIKSPADIKFLNRSTSIMFLIIMLAYCVAISVADQFIHKDITAFIIGMFAVAFTHLMNARQALMAFLIPGLALLYCFYYLQVDPIRLKGYYINIGSVTAIALVLSRIFYAQYIRDFINRDIIDKQKESLIKQSKEDFLTGLFNRRHLEHLLSQEFARAKRYKLKLSVAIADIDHFKLINDTFSHQVGDEVLKAVARIFLHSIRSFDIIARYGGEEFVLILPETDLDEAVMVCERIRKNIEEHDWSSIAQGLAVTISFGITDDMGLENHEKLLSFADIRLYEAKNGGRNQLRY